MTDGEIVLVALGTLVATLTLTWPLARALAAVGLVDRPNHRSMHAVEVPRGGGAGPALAVTVAMVLAVLLGLDDRALVVLALALGLAGIGFLDDRFNLPASPRLAVQLVVALGAAAIVRSEEWGDGARWALLPAIVVTIVWTLGCCNAFNFMDGVNAISGVHTIVFATSLLAVAHDDVVRAAAAMLIAAGGGFLYWNAWRRKVFLGDGGAYFLGAMLALLVVVAAVRGTAPLVAAAPFTIYAADTTTAIVKRAVRREDLADGHREHVYQRLTLSGRGHLDVAAFVGACSAACAAAGIAVDRGGAHPALGVAAVALIAAAYLTSPRWLGLPPDTGPRSHPRAGGTIARSRR